MPKRRTAVTLVWCLLLVVALVAAATRGTPAASADTSAAVAMVGADGLTTRYAQGDDVGSATWSRTTGGMPMASSGPDAFGWWLIVTDLDQSVTDLARFSWAVGAGTDTVHGDDLYSLTNGEVRRQAVVSGRTSAAYRGGLLELPADVHDGSSWTSQGALVTMQDGVRATPVTYTSTGAATKAADADLAVAGCLDVVIGQTIEGAAATTTTRTWCPGRGIVSFDVGGRQWRTTTSTRTPTLSADPSSFDWSRAADLSFSSVNLAPEGSGSVRSSSLLALSYLARPSLLPDGTLVAALKQNSDIVALDPAATTGNKDHTLWRAHPGGVIVTCATLGEVTVAVTTDRRISAYGPSGLALWSAPLPDTSTTRPVAFGGHIVVASVDGTVTALDPATGDVAWTVSLPNELQVRPVVTGDTLVVIDEGGTMEAIDADGKLVWQNAELPAAAFAVSAGVLVVSERGSTVVRGYDAASGNKLWRTWEPNLVSTLVDVGGVAVGYSSSGMVAFAPATGDKVWERNGQLYDAVLSGDRLLVLTATTIEAVDASGQVAAQWDHHITTLEQSSAYLMVTSTELAVATSQVLVRGVVS